MWTQRGCTKQRTSKARGHPLKDIWRIYLGSRSLQRLWPKKWAVPMVSNFWRLVDVTWHAGLGIFWNFLLQQNPMRVLLAACLVLCCASFCCANSLLFRQVKEDFLSRLPAHLRVGIIAKSLGKRQELCQALLTCGVNGSPCDPCEIHKTSFWKFDSFQQCQCVQRM